MRPRHVLLGAVAAMACGIASASVIVEAVDGTTLRVRNAQGRTLSGPALAGQSFALDGLRLRVTAVERSTSGVWLHDLQARNPRTGAWQPVCLPDRDGRRLATFLAGSTTPAGRFVPDPRRLSVTCTAGVEAKCLQAGYRLDDGSGRGRSLFQACTRMFRADYCGNGRPATEDGTPVDVFDDVVIQPPGDDAAFRFEAGWGPAGAVCVHHTRVPSRLTLRALQRSCPRLAASTGAACTEAAARRAGAVLFNRSAASPRDR